MNRAIWRDNNVSGVLVHNWHWKGKTPMKNNGYGMAAYEPFPEAGQYIVDCYEATTWEGKKEIRAHFNEKNVHEKIVRCGNCQLFDGKCKMTGLIVPMMQEWFCAGGVGLEGDE